jgi:pimeloyl-ACP methyl ester carboxylesterase
MREGSSLPSQKDRRIRLTHHLLTLEDGHEVGVSVGGRGVPLVFMHGLALSRRAYLRMLSRIAGLGFLVIASDAAGHGDTRNLPRDSGEFADRVDLTLRTLDALGVHEAVVAGHSMGGRMAIQLAAVAPDRVLAAVLFDAAAGASFDQAVSSVLRSPRRALRAILGIATDPDAYRLELAERSRYMRMLASVVIGNARRPTGVSGAARAIMQSGDYTPLLHAMRDQHVSTMVLHGERDMVVPFDSARDIAEAADAALYRVPRAYHSWMIANPRHGADSLRQLLNGDLGEVLRDAADAFGIDDWRDAMAWDRALLEPDARVRTLAPEKVVELGASEPEHVEMELVRCSQRPVSCQRVWWMRRTYRRRVKPPVALRQPRDHAERWQPAAEPDENTA